MQQKAAIFDRDGTLIEDKGYLSEPEEVVLLEGVRETLQTLKERGYLLGMATNQSGIARGFFNETDVVAVNQRLEEMAGLEFDAVAYCPHQPADSCRCRKPLPYMIDRILADLDCSIIQSFMAGDKRSDVEAARNAGVRSIWCRFGTGAAETAEDIADVTIEDFADILDFV